MSFIGLAHNEYGTVISVHRCDDCADYFTLCPPGTDRKWGGCCLATTCGSYDLSRDIDLIWDHVDVKRDDDL